MVTRTIGPEGVEVHLEELDAHSWHRLVPEARVEPYGRGQARFIVVPHGAAAHDLKDHVATSVSFPALRPQDPEGPLQPDAWLDVARQRLIDLDAELVRVGWRRRPSRGPNWWSFAYDAAGAPGDTTGPAAPAPTVRAA
jgi:hypothetical protein